MLSVLNQFHRPYLKDYALGITIAYATYHTIKMGNLASVHRAIDSDDWADVMQIAFQAASTAAKELHDNSSGLLPPDEEFFSLLQYPAFDDLV